MDCMKILLPIILIIMLTGCHSLNQAFGMKDDNPVEEAVEQAIENATGADIDLTPDSSEDDTLPCERAQ